MDLKPDQVNFPAQTGGEKRLDEDGVLYRGEKSDDDHEDNSHVREAHAQDITLEIGAGRIAGRVKDHDPDAGKGQQDRDWPLYVRGYRIHDCLGLITESTGFVKFFHKESPSGKNYVAECDNSGMRNAISHFREPFDCIKFHLILAGQRGQFNKLTKARSIKTRKLMITHRDRR